MFRNRLLGTVAVLACLVAISAPTSAEPYISKDLPPNDVILKAIAESGAVILGKTFDKNQVEVYYQESPTSDGVDSVLLIKLDTNIWLVHSSRFLMVVQK